MNGSRESLSSLFNNHNCWWKSIWCDSGRNVYRWLHVSKFYARHIYLLPSSLIEVSSDVIQEVESDMQPNDHKLWMFLGLKEKHDIRTAHSERSDWKVTCGRANKLHCYSVLMLFIHGFTPIGPALACKVVFGCVHLTLHYLKRLG